METGIVTSRQLRQQIELHAADLRNLQTKVHKAYDKRRSEAWREASKRFFDSYDNLAFPGGLARAIMMLAKKDPETIETAVCFLEADPWFFRSGYIKADVLKQLRRAGSQQMPGH